MQPRSGPQRPSGMKRPLSPSPPGEKEPPTSGATECPPRPPELPKPKRERKRPSYTLCDVCNIQLNSAAQAQVHCGGRAHQRRLRQLSLGKTPAGPDGALCGASEGRKCSWMDPIQKAVISHTFGVPSPLKKKLFISCNICHLRFNSANQAEAHYKGHKHARKLKAVEAAKSKQRPQTLARDGVLVSPTLTPASGSPGEPHSKAVPAAPPPGPQLQPPLTLDPTPREPAHSDLLDAASSSSSSSCPPCSPEPGREAPGPEPAVAAVGNGVNGEGRSEKGRLYCPTCKVTVNSASQLQAHNTGAKHRWMVEGQRGAPRRGRGRPVPRGGGHKAKRVAGGQGGRQGPSPPFHCALCQLQVNSETQLKQHLSSRRHKDRLAGKPPKPSSQHSKLQKHAALAVSILKSKLALQKQLTKTLAARFLPSPIPAAAAAICALPGPLALRPAPTAATTLFPAPILGPALFRTPAGAVRPATGPIVFAPY
ncbi:zinc finger protein 385C isoform X6 [Herpailurus yagouaroundi]|uniref:zinc finger protein 385C isoform X6 n=1 Tax=Felis catus TaxID=9685 RepID=UPI001AD7302E|nr:zinc finger protein 385C isoform X6 [Felis catus]XP_040353508.1 zinc finger protein 385C isoform X6 [Puma yagouaroundi]